MNSIIDELKEKAKSHPHNALLEDAIAHLLDLQHSAISGESRNISWDVIRRDFDSLEAEGLWEKSETDVKVLDELRSSMEGPDDSVSPESSVNPRTETNLNSDKITILIPEDLKNSSILNSIDPLVLPRELVDILNQTYFLHILGTDPTKVLPPGKSLLSVLSRPHFTNGRAEGSSPSLHDKVEDMVHKAFWNEVFDQPKVSVKYLTEQSAGCRIAFKPRTIYPARPHQTPIQRSRDLSETSPPSGSPSPRDALVSIISHILTFTFGRNSSS
jgi:hypothetical protein